MMMVHKNCLARYKNGVIGLITALFITILSWPLLAQIDTTHTADYLVREILVGNGVLIGDVKYTGEKYAIGLYRDSIDVFGIEEGIILTSGNSFYALGPNKTPHSGWISNAPGDEELDKIARGKTYDASVLEFEFVTVSENMSFEFVFGSEEYLEYVGSKYNDVFAFFIDGPGLEHVNIAKLPDQVTPITVNSVNHEVNEEFYIDNLYMNVTDAYVWDVRNRKVIWNENYMKKEVPAAFDTQFDGFTTLLTTRCRVVPNEVYKIKIAIADVGDRILDSGVLLKGGSFSSYGKEFVQLNDHFGERHQLKKLNRIEPELKVVSINMSKELNGITASGRIEFDFDKYHLSSSAKISIAQFYEQWKTYPDHVILVSGHTDNKGSDDYNFKLAEKRAQAVASELRRLGVPMKKLILDSRGELEPVQTNSTDFGRARNRRVELQLQS